MCVRFAGPSINYLPLNLGSWRREGLKLRALELNPRSPAPALKTFKQMQIIKKMCVSLISFDHDTYRTLGTEASAPFPTPQSQTSSVVYSVHLLLCWAEAAGNRKTHACYSVLT